MVFLFCFVLELSSHLLPSFTSHTNQGLPFSWLPKACIIPVYFSWLLSLSLLLLDILVYFPSILLHMVAPSLSKTYNVPLSSILGQSFLDLGDIKDRYTILRPQVYYLQLMLISELLKHHLLPFCLKIWEISVRMKRIYTYNLAKEPSC